MKLIFSVWAISVFLFLGGFLSQEASAQYGGGQGVSSIPWLITEPAHLLEIGANPTHWSRYFKLANDIDMSEHPWTAANIIGGAPKFTGGFDGDGFAIRNLHYTGAARGYDGVGLFGRVDGHWIRNLRLVNATFDIQGTDIRCIGGLVGYLESQIENCSAVYTMTTGDGATYVGGLVGYAGGGIINSSSHGALTVGKGSQWIGGLAGYAGSDVTNSHTSGTIVTVGAGSTCQYIGGLVGALRIYTGAGINGCSSSCSILPGGAADGVGGLVGRYNQGNITNSTSTGNVSGRNSVGGLVGSSRNEAGSTVGVISRCYSTAAVTGSNNVGGIVGYGEPATLIDSHSTGAVTGLIQVGGLAGVLWPDGSLTGSITNCFSTGSVTAGVDAQYVGGLVGLCSQHAVSNCYSTGAVVAGGGANTRYIGGLIGTSGGTMGPVTDSYSLSLVDGGAGSRWVGGLIGSVGNTQVARCFSAGAILSSGDYTGGLIGENAGATATITSCYWDKDTSGKDTSAGGKGYSTDVMQQQSIFQI